MTNNEFDVQFDVLYNNVTSNQAPGLNIYEKSVFLTKAQEELTKTHFLGHNPYNAQIDSNQKRQADFSALINSKVLAENTDEEPFAYEGRVYNWPDEIFLPLNEQLIVQHEDGDIPYTIVPIHYAEYDRINSKPYKLPPKYQAWRMFTGKNKCELICGASGKCVYKVRYVRYPKPIILGNIGEEYGVTIHGESNTLDPCCEFPEEMHQEILQRAVELAKTAWLGDAQLTTQSGQRSE